MQRMRCDTIYSDPSETVPKFVFDRAVANVFADMIQRSVPGYDSIISSISLITSRYAQAGTNLYDLGCSLGAATFAMQRGLGVPDCHITGIDSSGAMLEQCREMAEVKKNKKEITFKLGDICEEPLRNASVVTLNFTLQFIAIEKRLPLLEKIASGLNAGGVLILSEKLIFDDVTQNVLEPLQLDFKYANGYSELEVCRKREAIAGVLIPETLETHLQRLKAAGFSRASLWFQHFNFCSLIAIK